MGQYTSKLLYKLGRKTKESKAAGEVPVPIKGLFEATTTLHDEIHGSV